MLAKAPSEEFKVVVCYIERAESFSQTPRRGRHDISAIDCISLVDVYDVWRIIRNSWNGLGQPCISLEYTSISAKLSNCVG